MGEAALELLSLLLPGSAPDLPSQDGPVLGAVGSYSWSGGAFLYPPNKKPPTFINMSQENVDMADSYLGERRLWLCGQAGDELPGGRGQGWGLGAGDGWGAGGGLCAEAQPPQVTPPSWPFGRGCRAWSWGRPAISTPGRPSSSPRRPGSGGRRLKSQGPRLGVEDRRVMGSPGRREQMKGFGPCRGRSWCPGRGGTWPRGCPAPGQTG